VAHSTAVGALGQVVANRAPYRHAV
jgi:hypothetical protein